MWLQELDKDIETRTEIRITVDSEVQPSYMSEFDGGIVEIESNGYFSNCDDASFTTDFGLKLKITNSEKYLNIFIPTQEEKNEDTKQMEVVELKLQTGMKVKVYRSKLGFSYFAEVKSY
ncbi:hypothetical protein MMP65_19225 [Acinetobacter sp. ANC 3926]|uniref:Uncharacterized protein n=1 Tax=Acinetobacter genomosp. 15BJ TaxID=106651 RepID=R9B1Z3_9GAMM|nr:hypothetical protein [Acinetobacter genomosp. 15BJ]EOR06416.1 hypothetical protein F896_02876 [Acinetobacter genomosp. 15BJ]MCH7293571.1 hypothetical protein [Acinetobacter genomosp. 15BJ]